MKIVTILAWILLVDPAAAFAQAAIAGTVTDASGASMPGVIVQVTSPALIEKSRTAVTEGTGRYRIDELRQRTYTVAFTLECWRAVQRSEAAAV
jgi:Carboxypeptidase regulatory-like domain